MDRNITVSRNASLLQKDTFSKPPLNADEHIILMESRGLIIPDKECAKAVLEDNVYYRLSGYMLPFFDKSTNTYITGTTFEHITTIYIGFG